MIRRFKRARKPEQKDVRRAQLLATARAILEGGVDPRAMSLNELARQAGMAKANVYRYFETREAVLLALLWAESERWFATLVAEANAGRRDEIALDALVKLLARTLARQPLFCALTAALPSVLEQNLSEEAIRAFKQDTLAALGEVGEYLASRCPALPAAAYTELVNDAATMIMALYPTTHPAPATIRVLTAPELKFFRRDFGAELERFLRALAADYLAKQPGSGAVRARRRATR